MNKNKANIVIIGGGFAGLAAAKQFARQGFSVTIIDKRNFHLFQPLLYQVATGYLAPGDIATPIRTALKRFKSVQVIQSEVQDILPDQKVVATTSGNVSYDYLVVATGLTNNYFGNQDWSEQAPGLKSIEDALEIRTRILSAFEQAENELALGRTRKAQITLAVIGGGPTGVELAGALAELTRRTLKGEFRNINPAESRILLIEAGERVLNGFHAKSSIYSAKKLEHQGVEIRCNTLVREIAAKTLKLETANKEEILPVDVVIWAAGVKPTFMAELLAKRAGATLDRSGRVIASSDLSLKESANIFVLGDLASFETDSGKSLPAVAPVAIQQGHFVVRSVKAHLEGNAPPSFVYRDKGMMAVIGRGYAVAETGPVRLNGLIAWLAWAFIHIYYLIDIENKLVVFIRWAWNYLSYSCGSRLIGLIRKGER